MLDQAQEEKRCNQPAKGPQGFGGALGYGYGAIMGYSIEGIPGTFVTADSGQTYSTAVGTSMTPTTASGGFQGLSGSNAFDRDVFNFQTSGRGLGSSTGINNPGYGLAASYASPAVTNALRNQ